MNQISVQRMLGQLASPQTAAFNPVLALGAAEARLALMGMPALSGMLPAGVQLPASPQSYSQYLLNLLAGLMMGQQANPAGQTNGASPNGSSSSSPPATNGSSSSASSGASLSSSGDKVNQQELQAYLEQRIASSKLNGFKPSDGGNYGVDGSARSWAQFMVRLANKESGCSNCSVGDVGQFNGGSRGLFQLSVDDAKNYGLNGGQAFTQQQLADPKQNADAAVAIMERLVTQNGSISGGAGKYWGPIKRGEKI